jgi:molecular chaperone DnaK
VFQSERTLRDLGDKVSSADKAEVEQQTESLREALKGSDLGAVRAGAESLAAVLQRVGAAAYESAGGSANGASGGDGAAEEEAVEGEYKEV